MGAIHQALIAAGGGSAPGGVPGVATDIIFVDGAEHNTAANDKWIDTTSNPTIASGVTGAHGRCYDLSANPLILNLNQNLVSLAAGGRFRFRVDASQTILLFRDTASNNQLSIRYVAGGAVDILRGTTTSLDSTAAGLISLDTWYYMEMGATIDNTTGSVTVKIYSDAGTLLDTLTFAGDTQQTANAFANHVLVAGTNNDGYADDLWIADSATLYGPLRVETLYPDGDGALSQWVVGAGSGAEWELVDEAQNNDSTDYLQSITTGHISLFTFQNRALTGAIHAVQVSPVVSASAAVGGIQYRPLVRIGGVNYVGTTFTLDNTFETRPFCWGVSPATGLAWTDSELASAESGVERTNATINVWFTQIVVEVVCAI